MAGQTLLRRGFEASDQHWLSFWLSNLSRPRSYDELLVEVLLNEAPWTQNAKIPDKAQQKAQHKARTKHQHGSNGLLIPT